MFDHHPLTVNAPLTIVRPAIGIAAKSFCCSLMLLAPAAFAADLHSASVDRAGERIIVRGSGFDGGTAITLGGVAIPTANVSPTELDLPFGVEVASAAQWRASYALVADGTTRISLFIDAPINDPAPPPPPPPPPGGPDCPCISGWDASGIPKDNFTWCTYGQDGTQNYIYGQRDNWFIAAAHDPNDLFFDPVDPGNSVSFCSLHDGTNYTVAEPIVNEDQYWDCELYMWVNICI